MRLSVTPQPVTRNRTGAPGAPGARRRTRGAVLAVSAALVSSLTVAAPAHGRLGAGRGERDLAVLVRADRVRLAASLVAAAAAFSAAAR